MTPEGTGDEILSREDWGEAWASFCASPDADEASAAYDKLKAHDDALRRALEAECAGRDLHADINRDVAEALGLDEGESWHDLGAKVRRALGDAERRHRDVEHSFRVELNNKIEALDELDAADADIAAARERVRQLTEACQLLFDGEDEYAGSLDQKIRRRFADSGLGLAIVEGVLDRIRTALAAGEPE